MLFVLLAVLCCALLIPAHHPCAATLVIPHVLRQAPAHTPARRATGVRRATGATAGDGTLATSPGGGSDSCNAEVDEHEGEEEGTDSFNVQEELEPSSTSRGPSPSSPMSRETQMFAGLPRMSQFGL